MESLLFVAFVVIATAFSAGVFIARNLIYLCGPNEVLVFSGSQSRGAGNRVRNYRVIQGGRGTKIPLLEKVDRLDLTNMIIEVSVSNAYARGGIPLTVSGVANVKIASKSPFLDNAIERFTGKSREQIIRIAKETLEGNLRGVLSQLTPEEVNQDKIAFATKLLDEADHDLEKLGLELDTLKIQNVTDERNFLDSLGRVQSAEVIKTAKIAEAKSHSTATVKDAENLRMSRLAQISNQRAIILAEADRQVQDARTKQIALVAEERGGIAAKIARARADIAVQKARIEQVKRQLQADVIAPAEASMREEEESAKASAAKIREDGQATVTVLNEMITTWQHGGNSARDIFLMQKLQTVMGSMVSSIEDITIDKIAILPSNPSSTASRAAVITEELKAAVGIDLPQLIEGIARNRESK